MDDKLVNLIPFLPYLIILIFVIKSLLKKESWLYSTVLAFCFSSSILFFYFNKQNLSADGNLSVGQTAEMYASITLTIPLVITGWFVGKKVTPSKAITFGILALLCNFSVLRMYLYVINKNRNVLKQEIALDCQKLPFHCAIRDNKLEKISELKKFGADIEARDSLSRSPLWYAVNNKNAVKLILENGANPDSFNIYGETPLAYSLVISMKPDLEIAQLLIDHGANINRSVGFRKKISILNFAIVNKNINAINFALSNGAIANTPDDYKKTPCQRLKSFSKNQIINLEKYCPN